MLEPQRRRRGTWVASWRLADGPGRRFRFWGGPDDVGMSQEALRRIKAIRAAVENELRLLDALLARHTDPEQKRAIAVARRDVANIEADLLRCVDASPEPSAVLAAAGQRLSVAVATRKTVERQRPVKW